jgi:hypothetical protein
MKVSGLSGGGFKMIVYDENLINCAYSTTEKTFSFNDDEVTDLLVNYDEENDNWEVSCSSCSDGVYYVKCKDIDDHEMGSVTIYLM